MFCSACCPETQSGKVRIIHVSFIVNLLRPCNKLAYFCKNGSYWLTHRCIFLPQVVTIATYSYFLACTIGRQYLDPSEGYEGNAFDLYFPGFTVLEFVFYVGWLKVSFHHFVLDYGTMYIVIKRHILLLKCERV